MCVCVFESNFFLLFCIKHSVFWDVYVVDMCMRAEPAITHSTAPRASPIVKPLINVMLLIIASANAHKQFFWFVLFSFFSLVSLIRSRTLSLSFRFLFFLEHTCVSFLSVGLLVWAGHFAVCTKSSSCMSKHMEFLQSNNFFPSCILLLDNKIMVSVCVQRRYVYSFASSKCRGRMRWSWFGMKKTHITHHTHCN